MCISCCNASAVCEPEKPKWTAEGIIDKYKDLLRSGIFSVLRTTQSLYDVEPVVNCPSKNVDNWTISHQVLVEKRPEGGERIMTVFERYSAGGGVITSYPRSYEKTVQDLREKINWAEMPEQLADPNVNAKNAIRDARMWVIRWVEPHL